MAVAPARIGSVVHAMTAVALLSVAVDASAETLALPSLTNTTISYTSNWSGYAALPGTALTSVQGDWVAPTINSSVTPNGYASIWVGMDGYHGGDTIEQCGITAYCATPEGGIGWPQYYAWYEMYPAGLNYFALTINAGDRIHAEVDYQGGNNFYLLVNDLTTGQSDSTTQSSSTAARSSAEWIVEAPSSGGILPLPDFSPVTFAGAYATVNGGSSSPISSFANNYQITMLPTSSGLGANTSALDGTGAGFTVTATPEPSALVLAAAGLAGLLAYAWRKRR